MFELYAVIYSRINVHLNFFRNKVEPDMPAPADFKDQRLNIITLQTTHDFYMGEVVLC